MRRSYYGSSVSPAKPKSRPPPTPQILHFPVSYRGRRRSVKPAVRRTLTSKSTVTKTQPRCLALSYGWRLSDRENKEEEEEFSGLLNGDAEGKIVGGDERRRRVGKEERVEVEVELAESRGEEENWRFQAEVLRAECNSLRMERRFALKKLEKNRVILENTLKSAVQTLVNGRKRISESQTAKSLLEEEIRDLKEKLEKSSRTSDCRVHNCNEKTSILKIKLGEERSTEIQTIYNVQEKLDELSNSLLDTFEEEKASSSRGFEASDCSSSSDGHLFQGSECRGRCKALVGRIVEQVRAETEQWSQMQEMLAKVRGEMEQLHLSRDYWENRARSSGQEVQFLRLVVDQWRDRAACFENKAKRLQHELKAVKEKLPAANLQILKEKPVTKNADANKENREIVCVSLGEKFPAKYKPTALLSASEARNGGGTRKKAVTTRKGVVLKEIQNAA